MENSETINAVLLFSTLFQMKGMYSYAQYLDFIKCFTYWNSLSSYDHLYPLKPKNPI